MKRLMVLAVAVTLVGCSLDKQAVPALTGPSELGLSLDRHGDPRHHRAGRPFAVDDRHRRQGRQQPAGARSESPRGYCRRRHDRGLRHALDQVALDRRRRPGDRAVPLARRAAADRDRRHDRVGRRHARRDELLECECAGRHAAAHAPGRHPAAKRHPGAELHLLADGAEAGRQHPLRRIRVNRRRTHRAIRVEFRRRTDRTRHDAPDDASVQRAGHLQRRPDGHRRSGVECVERAAAGAGRQRAGLDGQLHLLADAADREPDRELQRLRVHLVGGPSHREL